MYKNDKIIKYTNISIFPTFFSYKKSAIAIDLGRVEWWPVCGWSGVGGMHGIHPGWEIGCFKQISD